MQMNSGEILKIYGYHAGMSRYFSYSIPSDLCLFFAKIRMNNKLLLFCLLVLSLRTNAQYGGNSSISPEQHHFDTHYLFNQIPPETNNYKQWIVPGAMILYGFLTIHYDPLTDLSEDVKEEVWTEDPHKTISIDNYLQFVPALAVYGLNAAGIKGEHDFFDRTMIYALSNVILGVTVFSLKSITHEQRPDGSDYYSFPSGHTAEAFASAEFLRQEYKNVSVWYGIGGYVVATSVAYLRIYNNKHWLNDVVAGAGFGIVSTRLSYLLYPKIQKLFAHGSMHDSVVLPFYQDKTAGLTLIHSFK
jgi:membrane-associated phospholipid phosphatase